MKNTQKDLSSANDIQTEGEEKIKEEVEILNDWETKLAKAEEMAKKFQDSYLRAVAETENIRKRNQREREEYLKFAALPVIKKLLGVIDDFERALNNKDSNQDLDALNKGMEMIYKKLVEIITTEGVMPIEALNQPFDPEFHNPLMMEASEAPENTVIEELQKGYIMHGRVIRPSLVKVSN